MVVKLKEYFKKKQGTSKIMTNLRNIFYVDKEKQDIMKKIIK